MNSDKNIPILGNDEISNPETSKLFMESGTSSEASNSENKEIKTGNIIL